MKIANVFPLLGIKKQFRQKHFDQCNMLNIVVETKGTAYKMRNNDAFFQENKTAFKRYAAFYIKYIISDHNK